MNARRLLVSGFFCFAIGSAMIAPAIAEEVAPAVENSRKAAIGEINSNAVQVRSGAGDTYYATMKLDKGAQVTVVGYKFDWLKIIPPEGSFCVVGKVYVEKDAAGTSGKIKGADVNVRAGSTLNAMRTTIQTKLNEGDTVEIIGEESEFYKIKPPKSVALYVSKQFVDPVREVAAGDPSVTPTTHPSGVVDSSTTIAGAPPTTQPLDNNLAVAPSTQPTHVTSAAEGEFDKLEAEFADASKKPIEDQPLAEMKSGYDNLVAGNAIPESMRRIAEFRVGTLKVRADAREQFVAVKKIQEDNQKKQQALKSEQQEIQAQIAKNDVTIYTAVGTLRTSSLQQGDGMLYRLTDPGTGRTVVYIRSSDAKIASLIGQFIGVKGDLAADSKLSVKVVAPTEMTVVKQEELYKSVAAQVVPPSMLPKTTASSGIQ